MIIRSATHNDKSVPVDNKKRPELDAVVIERATVGSRLVQQMYALYADNYEDTTWPLFQQDLASKTHVVLLRDRLEKICGFSTLQLYASTAAGRAIQVIYSGDTIIDPRHWGNSALAFEWLRFAGSIRRETADVPLYWLLIVKGHRTYRFLSTFARHYVPQPGAEASAGQRHLLRALATEKFAEHFDPATGIVRFDSPRGRLREDLTEVPERHRRLAAVKYFLECNPGYREGDELVCICELAAGNLRPLAARVFEASLPRS